MRPLYKCSSTMVLIVLRLYTAIEGAFRINDNQRSVLAEAMAACFDNHNLILQAELAALWQKISWISFEPLALQPVPPHTKT